MKAQTQLEKALAKAAKLTGETPDIKALAESWTSQNQESLMLEAQSAINYFDSKGKNWHRAICKECGESFAYDYHYAGITRCSIRCMKKSLSKMGIKWNPDRELTQRWGRYHPAIVPKVVVDAYQESLSAEQQLDLLEYLKMMPETELHISEHPPSIPA